MVTRRQILALSAALAAGRAGAVPVPTAPDGEPMLDVRLDFITAANRTLAEQRYREFQKYIQDETGAKLKLSVSSTSEVEDLPLNSVMVGSPLLIRRAMSLSFTPLAQTNLKDRVIFVAKTTSSHARIKHYQGQRIILPAQGTQGEFMARWTLQRQMIPRAEAFFAAVRYATSDDSGMKALIAGVVEVAAIMDKAVPMGEPDLGKLLASPPYPRLGLAVRNRPGNAFFERLRKALFLPSDAGRKALESANISPLDPIDPVYFPAT